MRALKIVATVAALVGALGFAGYHGYLYSLGLYATAPVYATADGAIDGYDPVAYFADGTARKGLLGLSHDWDGATWHFATPANLAAFRQEPARYAPQFGGYCAYAVANRYTARSDPMAWHIEDGKLYLNFNAEVRETWRGNKAAFIQSATANWPAVILD